MTDPKKKSITTSSELEEILAETAQLPEPEFERRLARFERERLRDQSAAVQTEKEDK